MLHNFGLVTPALARCAQPDGRGFADLSTLGFSHVLKLNSDADYPHTQEALEFRGVVWHCPLSALHPDNAVVRPLVAELQALLAAGARVVVHCELGRDRTGYVIAAYQLLALGWPLPGVEGDRAYFSEGLSQWLFKPAITHALEELAG